MRDIELAYLAGAIDSGGCISIDRFRGVKNREWYYVLKVNITGPESMINWIAEKVSGLAIGYVYQRRPKNPSYRPVFTWRLTGPKASEVLKKIKCYLVLKKERAEIGIKMQQTYIDNSERRSSRESTRQKKMEKERLYLELKKMNQRGLNGV